MKIVFLAPFGIRPKGTVIARMLPLAVELQKLNHQVTIIAPPYTNPEDSGKTEIIRGVRLVNVVLPVGGTVVTTLKLTWRMFRAALTEQPDLVHLFKPKGYGGLASMLLVSLRRLGMRLPPVVVDTDDWEGKGGMNDLHSYSGAEKRLFAFQEQWLSRYSEGVTVASRELERLTLAMGVDQQRLVYLPNGVDTTPRGNGSSLREQWGITTDTPVVLLYTRFFEFSQERLHRVFSGIYAQVPGVRFLVVGKGRHGEEEQLLSASRAMGFDRALIMAGWVEPTEIPDYLVAADVAIYPLDNTLVNRAKCPAKLTEIIRAGIPVVADRVGQVTEYLGMEHGELLCDPDSADSMIEKTVSLLHDPSGRMVAGEERCHQLMERFMWSHLAGELDAWYCSRGYQSN